MSFDWTPYPASGEEVLWQGQPDGRLALFLTGADFFLVPFGILMWLCGCIAAMALPFGGEIATALPVFLLLIAMLAHFFPGHQLRDRSKRRALRYAITRQRVLRIDARAGGLAERAISADLHIGLRGRHFPTVEIDRYKPSASIPVPSVLRLLLGYQWDGTAVGASWDPHIGMFLGYVEYGLELRRLRDGRDVARLLRRLKDEARP